MRKRRFQRVKKVFLLSFLYFCKRNAMIRVGADAHIGPKNVANSH